MDLAESFTQPRTNEPSPYSSKTFVRECERSVVAPSTPHWLAGWMFGLPGWASIPFLPHFLAHSWQRGWVGHGNASLCPLILQFPNKFRENKKDSLNTLQLQHTHFLPLWDCKCVRFSTWNSLSHYLYHSWNPTDTIHYINTFIFPP